MAIYAYEDTSYVLSVLPKYLSENIRSRVKIVFENYKLL